LTHDTLRPEQPHMAKKKYKPVAVKLADVLKLVDSASIPLAGFEEPALANRSTFPIRSAQCSGGTRPAVGPGRFGSRPERACSLSKVPTKGDGMEWVASSHRDPVTHEWLQAAGFEPSGPDNGADDRPDWLLWDKEHERVLLTVRIHTDAATCAAYFGLIDGAEYFPWDIYEKAVVRHLCEAVGCRLTV